MNRITAVVSLALLAALPPLEAKKHGRGRKIEVSVAFSTGEVRVIREYYRTYPQSLPPGLQKKLARGGTLPPGWQKKIAPFPPELERRLPPLACGECSRGVIEGHAVIYNRGTMVVFDVAAILVL